MAKTWTHVSLWYCGYCLENWQVLVWEILSKHYGLQVEGRRIQKSIKIGMKGIRKSVSVITRGHTMVWKLLV